MNNSPYQNLMQDLRNTWNYKFHNTTDNIVEPYPEHLRPSAVARELHLNSSEQLDNLLKHADHIYSNPHLKNYLPYSVVINYNNSKPYTATLYAKNSDSARVLAIKKFASEMQKYNSPLSRTSLINMQIQNGNIILKIKQI